MAEWRNGGMAGTAVRWKEWQNGQMAGMATYVLFTVDTHQRRRRHQQRHNDDDDDDTLIFYSIDKIYVQYENGTRESHLLILKRLHLLDIPCGT
jgi:hypothetical protein